MVVVVVVEIDGQGLFVVVTMGSTALCYNQKHIT
jgi:hypothetical protein